MTPQKDASGEGSGWTCWACGERGDMDNPACRLLHGSLPRPDQKGEPGQV